MSSIYVCTCAYIYYLYYNTTVYAFSPRKAITGTFVHQTNILFHPMRPIRVTIPKGRRGIFVKLSLIVRTPSPLNILEYCSKNQVQKYLRVRKFVAVDSNQFVSSLNDSERLIVIVRVVRLVA